MRWSIVRGRRIVACLLAGSCGLVCTPGWTAAPAKSPTPPAELGAALQAEARGDETERAAHLEAALQAAPNDARVRGAAGFLRQGDRWVGYDAVAAQAKSDRRLADYRDRRKNSEPTVASQLALADWCKSKRLVEQERVHLTAVLSLDPNHAAARARLGHSRVGDRWLSSEELGANQSQARLVAESFRKHGDSLAALGKQIQRGELAEGVAVERLAQFAEPTDIPAIEAFVSQAGDRAARCVVAALSQRKAPEASLSLVRHALAATSPDVRRVAVTSLQARDRHSFIPAILASLETPFQSQAELYQARDGRLLCRYSLFSDGPDRRQLAVHDHVLQPVGFAPTAFNEAAGQVALSVARRNAMNAANTQRAELWNSTLAGLLREITGAEVSNDAGDWWRWWNDQNECYVEGTKPLDQVYAITSSYVVGTPPVVNVPVTTGSGTQTRGECLAGGTLIWTETGPVAVDRVKLGDLVLAQDPQSGQLALKPVLRTTVRAPERLLRIQLGEHQIRATGGHPFWVAGKGWTLARQLRTGDLLHGVAGSSSIGEITEETEPVRTFNLVVADYHNYFCGPQKTLSHDNSVRQPTTHALPGLPLE